MINLRALLRRGPASAIVGLAVAAGVTKSMAEEPPASQGTDGAAIRVELNRAEPIDDGCRLSFVIENRTPEAFESMQWDLYFFDRDGLITGRMAAEVAPLRAGKTSVKQFDVPGIGCNSLGRVLVNDVLRCESADGQAKIDCLGLTLPSSRADIQLIR